MLDTIQNRENRNQDSNLKSELQNMKSTRSAFTLTELLVVITIIAVLASLTIGAVMRALNTAKQTGITLELQQIGTAIEGYKNEYGSYPPNAMTPEGVNTNSDEMKAVRADVTRALTKAFPRNTENSDLVGLLIGDPNITGSLIDMNNGPAGLTAAEAVVFWLGGFSKDVRLPFSGPGGPSFVKGDIEVLENRNWSSGYEFDLGRLGPRDSNGIFIGRYIEYVQNGVDRRINLWTYNPEGSQQPCLYFDTSGTTPEKRFDATATGTYKMELQSRVKADDSESPTVYAFRQRLANVTAEFPIIGQTKFVTQGKFQVLHCGTDDAWGDFSGLSYATNGDQAIIAPDGPFLGEIADTLGNFMDGTLEDKQE